MSAKTFTDRQGQYLAFIDAYTRVNGRPPAESDMQRRFGVQPAVRTPDGAHAGAPRAHPTPAGGGTQHRGAPRPRGPACPTPPRTGQILCAGELEPDPGPRRRQDGPRAIAYAASNAFLHGVRAPMTLTRRDLFAGAASAAAVRPARASTDVDVVVIGAGAAGLAAAHRITAAGRSLVVLEAR